MNSRILAALVAAPHNRLAVCGYVVDDIYDVMGVLLQSVRKYTDEPIKRLYKVDPEVQAECAAIGLSIIDAYELQVYSENYILGDNTPEAQHARYNRLVEYAKYLLVQHEKEAASSDVEEEGDLADDPPADPKGGEET